MIQIPTFAVNGIGFGKYWHRLNFCDIELYWNNLKFVLLYPDFKSKFIFEMFDTKLIIALHDALSFSSIMLLLPCINNNAREAVCCIGDR